MFYMISRRLSNGGSFSIYNLFPGDRPALPVIVVPPTTNMERQKAPPLPPILRRGPLRSLHPTLVVRKKSSTDPAALTSHKSLTDGVRGCSNLHASPTSFQSLRLCHAHDAHRVNS